MSNFTSLDSTLQLLQNTINYFILILIYFISARKMKIMSYALNTLFLLTLFRIISPLFDIDRFMCKNVYIGH